MPKLSELRHNYWFIWISIGLLQLVAVWLFIWIRRLDEYSGYQQLAETIPSCCWWLVISVFCFANLMVWNRLLFSDTAHTLSKIVPEPEYFGWITISSRVPACWNRVRTNQDGLDEFYSVSVCLSVNEVFVLNEMLWWANKAVKLILIWWKNETWVYSMYNCVFFCLVKKVLNFCDYILFLLEWSELAMQTCLSPSWKSRVKGLLDVGAHT